MVPVAVVLGQLPSLFPRMAVITRFAMLAPFRVRSFRFQFPADLATSWGIEMENLVLGWYILVETGSVLALTLFWALLYLGTLLAPVFGMAGDRIGHRAILCAMRGAYAALGGRRCGAGLRRGTASRLCLHHRHAVGADPAVRPGAAQRAGGRDDAARHADGDDGRVAHDLGFGARFSARCPGPGCSPPSGSARSIWRSPGRI